MQLFFTTPQKNKKTLGFTIVELLIVVVVIAILAAITIVAYNGVTAKAKDTTLKNDLQSAATQIQIAKTTNGSYPATVSLLQRSTGTIFQYSYASDTFCLTATRLDYSGKSFSIANDSTIQTTLCAGHSLSPSADVTFGVPADGSLLQTITSSNCTTTRIRGVDARDNNTYWVQKLSDGNCWMLTNLAYAGGTSNGGVSTYNDTKVLTNGTTFNSYSAPYYFIPTGANPTVNPTAPSTSTTGTGQYGYLYNWCAAMGAQNGSNGQANTAVCNVGTTPTPDTNFSICPSGWRLPTISPTNEFTTLNTAVNGGLTNTDAGLRTNWLSMYGGYARSGLNTVGSTSGYYSSSQNSSTYAYYLSYGSGSLVLNQSNDKYIGFAVRCIAI